MNGWSGTKRLFAQPPPEGVLHALRGESSPIGSLEATHVEAVGDATQTRDMGLFNLLDDRHDLLRVMLRPFQIGCDGSPNFLEKRGKTSYMQGFCHNV